MGNSMLIDCNIKNFYYASGIGRDNHKLVSFDNALMRAGFSEYNLVQVSSILPINCKLSKIITLKKGLPLLVAYGSITSNETNATISSAVSIAIPQIDNEIGIIMEFSGYCDKHTAELEVNKMSEVAMRNHKIPIKEILCSSIEATITDEYTTVFSGVALW